MKAFCDYSLLFLELSISCDPLALFCHPFASSNSSRHVGTALFSANTIALNHFLACEIENKQTTEILRLMKNSNDSKYCDRRWYTLIWLHKFHFAGCWGWRKLHEYHFDISNISSKIKHLFALPIDWVRTYWIFITGISNVDRVNRPLPLPRLIFWLLPFRRTKNTANESTHVLMKCVHSCVCVCVFDRNRKNSEEFVFLYVQNDGTDWRVKYFTTFIHMPLMWCDNHYYYDSSDRRNDCENFCPLNHGAFCDLNSTSLCAVMCRF